MFCSPEIRRPKAERGPKSEFRAWPDSIGCCYAGVAINSDLGLRVSGLEWPGPTFRVEPVVSHRLPHSPVLAQLRPTVLRGTASLHSQRYPLGFGYRGSDLRVSRLLLPYGSVAPDRSLPYSPAAWVSFAGLPSVL